jgi:FixJ family two-component response regulator
MSEIAQTVFVVDDDLSVRKSLVRLLKSMGYLARPFGSGKEFLDDWRNDPRPGCLVLDVQLPGLNGLELQEELRESVLPIAIIFITGHGDIPMSVRAMKAGAVDFLAKPFHDEDLLRAVQEAIARGQECQAEVAEREALSVRFATLTPREREVMTLVVRGFPNKRIASDLGTSEKTIKVHRGRVMEKMNVRSVADLVRASQKLELEPTSLPHDDARRMQQSLIAAKVRCFSTRTRP